MCPPNSCLCAVPQDISQHLGTPAGRLCCKQPALLTSPSRSQLTLSVIVRSSSWSALSVLCCESAMASSGRQPAWKVTKKAAKSSHCRARRDNLNSAGCSSARAALHFNCLHLYTNALTALLNRVERPGLAGPENKHTCQITSTKHSAQPTV